LRRFFDPLKSKYKTANGTTRYMILMLLLLGLLFGSIFAFKLFQRHMVKQFMANRSDVVTVSATRACYDFWQPKLKATASLRAVKGVEVTTELAGMVRTIYFKPGSTVKYGTLLVELNTASDVAQLHSLQAIAALAKVVYQRDKAQFAIHAVSKATLDTDAADLKSKEAQVAQQEAIIAKKCIRAPFDGRLGISAINPGQYLNAGDTITTLQALNPIYVNFYVPQQALVQLQVCQPIILTIDTYPNRSFNGEITTISPKVDPATRNVAVEATVENPKELLLPGMFGTAEIATGMPQSYLTLPQTAINYNAYGNIAFIVKETGKDEKGKPILTVTQTFVFTGPTRGDQVAVLSGLKEGDLVVTAGQTKLKNGSKVEINNKIAPSDNPLPQLKNE
jgi:membrane fusion protein (multidrug efflux system)